MYSSLLFVPFAELQIFFNYAEYKLLTAFILSFCAGISKQLSADIVVPVFGENAEIIQLTFVVFKQEKGIISDNSSVFRKIAVHWAVLVVKLRVQLLIGS